MQDLSDLAKVLPFDDAIKQLSG